MAHNIKIAHTKNKRSENMGWTEFDDELVRLQADRHTPPLEIEVYRIFKRQPTQIGTGANNLRPLDLSDQDDRDIFLGAVGDDIQRLMKEKGGFTTNDSVIKPAFLKAKGILLG